MTDAIKEESVGYIFNVEVQVEPAAEEAVDDAPVLVAKGLVTPQAPAQLQYSAPSVDAEDGVEVRGESGAPQQSSGSTNRAERRANRKRR